MWLIVFALGRAPATPTPPEPPTPALATEFFLTLPFPDAAEPLTLSRLPFRGREDAVFVM